MVKCCFSFSSLLLTEEGLQSFLYGRRHYFLLGLKILFIVSYSAAYFHN